MHSCPDLSLRRWNSEVLARSSREVELGRRSKELEADNDRVETSRTRGTVPVNVSSTVTVASISRMNRPHTATMMSMSSPRAWCMQETKPHSASCGFERKLSPDRNALQNAFLLAHHHQACIIHTPHPTLGLFLRIDRRTRTILETLIRS
jgi:hypothetical protein